MTNGNPALVGLRDAKPGGRVVGLKDTKPGGGGGGGEGGGAERVQACGEGGGTKRWQTWAIYWLNCTCTSKTRNG